MLDRPLTDSRFGTGGVNPPVRRRKPGPFAAGAGLRPAGGPRRRGKRSNRGRGPRAPEPPAAGGRREGGGPGGTRGSPRETGLAVLAPCKAGELLELVLALDPADRARPGAHDDRVR